MSWRHALAVLFTVFVFVGAACGDDSRDTASMTELAVYDFDRQPTIVRHDGRPLVINFFAETCAPCVAEMPAFESVFQTVSDRVDFVGISEDATATAGTRIARQTGITYRAVWDGDGTAFAQFGAFGLPTTVFVTAGGAVAEVHTGALSAEDLATKISHLFDG